MCRMDVWCNVCTFTLNLSVKVFKKRFHDYTSFFFLIFKIVYLFVCLSFCLFCLFGLRNYQFLSAYEFAHIHMFEFVQLM